MSINKALIHRVLSDAVGPDLATPQWVARVYVAVAIKELRCQRRWALGCDEEYQEFLATGELTENLAAGVDLFWEAYRSQYPKDAEISFEDSARAIIQLTILLDSELSKLAEHFHEAMCTEGGL